MNKVITLRITFVCLFATIASRRPTIAAVQSTFDAPPGWAVSAAPADPAFANFSEEQLVDLLRESEPTVWTVPKPFDSFWAIGGRVSLGGGAVAVPIRSPAAIELVRRGQRALPALIDHLTDARPTNLVYVVRNATPGRKPELMFGDEYDPRVRGTANALSSISMSARTPVKEGGTYTFKVGDLCYATLGQIVNRDLRVVRCDGEDAEAFSGSRSANPGDWFLTINSPVARPALAAAVRADWGSIDAHHHADSLRTDIQKPVRQQSLDNGALTRLLYYYPDIGAEAAEVLVRRKLVEPATGARPVPTPLEENSVGFWQQAQFIERLAALRSDRLQAALLDLFRRAAATAVADQRSQPIRTWDPSIPSLGSDLALKCAQRLTRQGYDDELKAFFSARAAAMEAADTATVPDLGRSPDSSKIVNQMQAENCREFIAELERTSPSSAPESAGVVTPSAKASAHVRLGPISLKWNESRLIVSLEPLEPLLERVFVGRLVVENARDDVGASLWQQYTPTLAPVAVGRTSDHDLIGLPKVVLSATLTRPSPQAKALRSLEGRVEIVVPDVDPDSVVTVGDIATSSGAPLDSKSLRAAGVSITIHSGKTLNEGGGATQGPRLFKEDPRLATEHLQTPMFEAGDIGLSISDPNERFLDVEFRDAHGGSLRYNHNGWSHSSSAGSRFDVYRLGNQVPPGTRMVVWLKTERSFLTVPFKATNLKLPNFAP